ncbi:MAG: 4'-phosphopantetheinyl transferase family protein [Thermoguttaceae bacterium]
MKCIWPIPPVEIDLPAGEVHLWAARLDPPDDFLRQCATVLSEDEHRRAERFRAGSLRDRYIAGRGTLRMLLSRYLRTDPASFSLSYQAHGKPELGSPWKARGVDFNLSHSHELAVYAFTRGGEIGVDVECIRPMPNAAELLERFFSPEEVQQWQQMPAERQLPAFFRGWTRKEAWLKAVGSGLSFPLNQFCVSLDDPARVLSIRGDADEAARWWLESCEPWDGCVAAVAMRGQAKAVQRWLFGESCEWHRAE